MSQEPIQFLYGDRELLIQVSDLLSSPVEVIVNPANSGLSHGGGLAAQILEEAGEELERQSEMLIREHGQLESGMAVYTDAGNLSFKAVIHAVGPRMGEGDEQKKIEQAVSRSLLLCETNDWQSIAFPAISTGIFNVPVETCAKAFFRAITSFWDARMDTSVEKIILCLSHDHFKSFYLAFRDDAILTEEKPELMAAEEKEESVGHVELNEEELPGEDDEVSDWFK